jgi:hypothetical protein
MLCFVRPGRCLLAALVIVYGLPTVAAAQNGGLKFPTIAASTAAVADWASTYHALKYYRVRETNPLLRPLDHSPKTLVVVGALVDAGAFSAWNLTVGRKNERLAAAGLWAMAAFRTYLVIHNLRTERRAARR